MPGVGEVFREQWGIGHETTAGVPAVATRKVYLTNPSLTRTRTSRPHPFMTGDRVPVRAHTLGPEQDAGQVALPLSADEIIEWLLCGMQGGVTPTTPGGATNARLWTFTPGGNTLDSMTIERNDGTRLWQARGVYVDQMTVAGNVTAETTFTGTLFPLGIEPVDSVAALADRVPTLIEGWETQIAVGAFGADPSGFSNITQWLTDWTVTIGNGLGRKYFAQNTLQAGAIPLGAMTITAQLTVDALAAQSLTEYLNWDGQTPRIVKLLFGQNSVIDAGTNQVLTLTTTGTPAGGTFTLTYAGQTTSALPFNATAAQVQAALRVLNNIGYQDVAATGGPLPTGIVLTFQNGLAGQPITLTHTDSLTGGSSPAVAIANTTPGVAGFKRYVEIDLPGAWSAFGLDQANQGTRAYQPSLQYIYDPTNAYGVRVVCQSSRSTAW